MDVLPQKNELALLLPEVKIVRYIKLLMSVSAPLAVVALWSQIQFGDPALMPQALLGALLIVTLPYQGMLWLGWRARQQLPPALRGWYRELHARMEQEGIGAQALKSRPLFLDMGELLRQAYKALDSVFSVSRSDNRPD